MSGNGNSFFALLRARVAAVDSLLCVGLDPHAGQLPSQGQGEDDGGKGAGTDMEAEARAAVQFCVRLVEATAEHAAAYKPNVAFFERLGPHGWSALQEVVQAIKSHTEPPAPVLLDAKRGDISTTAQAYAEALLGSDCARAAGGDGVTLSPYMGWDSIEPFVCPTDQRGEEVTHQGRGAFVLCKTSNPSADELQALSLGPVPGFGTGRRLYEEVARRAQEWNHNAARRAQPEGEEKATVDEEDREFVGLVVGATDTEAIRRVRQVAPTLWILAPGVGAQGGNLDAVCAAGLRADGLGLLIPVSRGISKAVDPGQAAAELRSAINAHRTDLAAESDAVAAATTTALKPFQHQFLKLAMEQEVLRFGQFTLKSGRQSPYFFNAGLFRSGSALARLGDVYAAAILDAGVEFDVLFGPAYKGIPLVTTVSVALSSQHGRDCEVAYNRKEAKDHGEGGTLVGASVQGRSVLIVDDVITAGTAIRESMTLLQAHGANVVGVAIALDRQERVSETDTLSAVQAVQQEFGIQVVPVATLNDILQYCSVQEQEAIIDDDVMRAVRAYKVQYGV